ncbi:long-chain fatty acid--CoA ligase [Exiguobacterium sp. SH5S13]|uniref:AMP-binding protein n=1 Tax=Exiguobacterium sp. SH5S13 TaxID=2510959 RepID=UPI0010396880|nr:AMP-binding protein [Exiguobacterium sp. SH5S13]TCI50940.1 long-chain fatty acid--CoA ligase [Exiguobacterium sp. SH5S13]
MEKPWLQDYPADMPETIDYEVKPLYEALSRAAKDFPDRTAVSFIGKDLTFAQIDDAAHRLATMLQSRGLQKGDRVSLMLPNCPQYVISFYAVLYAGGTVVQTNPLYTEYELENLITDSGAKIVITLDLLYPKSLRVKEKTDIQTIITTSIADYLPFPKNKLYPIKVKREHNIVIDTTGSVAFKDFKNFGPVKPIEIDPKQDVAVLQYTGGTTGLPKGVMLTHFNLTANVDQISNFFYKYNRGDEKRVLSVVPFFHVYGMTCCLNFGVANGYELILVPRFDVTDVLKTINKKKPHFFPGAPTMYVGILNDPKLKKYDLSSIEACISGSAPLPVEVQEQFEDVTGGRIVEGYGLSETSPVTHANFLWDKRIVGSIGVPLSDTSAKIVKADGETLAEVGEIGEVFLNGPQVMKGYWQKPEETAAVLKDGWLATGDLGYMGEDGFFYIVDRKKDMIIAGGFNVYPREIEEVLYEHPAVKEAVCIGVPDPYRGETVKAFIVTRDGVNVTEDELDKHCREKLAAYKVPKLYEFRDELPKTFVGKILRRVLVDEEKAKQVKQSS